VTVHDFTDQDTQYGFNRIDYEAIQHIPILREVLQWQPHLASELLLQLLAGRRGVLDRVVEDRRHQRRQVADAAGRGEHGRDLDRVVDVRGRAAVLAALVPMLVGREVERLEQPGGVVHRMRR